MIGREISPATEFNSMEERQSWIGKPWRRLELLVHRHHWRGEVETTDWTFSVNIGSRRLGLNLNVSLTRDACMDYSEETQ